MNRGYQFSTDAGLDETEDDIEREYEINPKLLNQKYTGFKKQYEEEEGEDQEEDQEEDLDDETDDDYVDEEVKETIHGDDEEESGLDDDNDDDDFNTPDEGYQEIILKSIFRIIYKARRNWIKVMIYLLLFCTNLCIISYLRSNPQQDIITNVRNFGDISKSIQHLQWQINDINNKNKNKLQDFKNYLDLKIDEFNLKFNQIDDNFKKLNLSNKEILQKIENLNFQNNNDNNKIIIENDKLPVILDEYNEIKILPEFNEFLIDKIQSILNNEINESKFQLNYEKFIENYVEEIINSKIGFMQKDEILSLISLQFQENKKKLINEIKNLIKINQNDQKQQQQQQINDIPRRLINQDQSSSSSSSSVGKVNYGQSISGARIINYLTSSTFKPKYRGESIFKIFSKKKNQDIKDEDELELSKIVSPFIVLTPTDGYWKSSIIENTQLSIKFLEPIYMNEFWYIHKKVMNGAILTSTPQNLELYIQLERNVDDDDENIIEKYDLKNEIQGHFKISELKYDLNGPLEQKFELPDFVSKYLTKSIIIIAKDNYGNEFFTSFYKFKIHGITKFDLYSIKKIMNNDDINDSIKKKFKGIKSFGEDVMI